MEDLNIRGTQSSSKYQQALNKGKAEGLPEQEVSERVDQQVQEIFANFEDVLDDLGQLMQEPEFRQTVLEGDLNDSAALRHENFQQLMCDFAVGCEDFEAAILQLRQDDTRDWMGLLDKSTIKQWAELENNEEAGLNLEERGDRIAAIAALPADQIDLDALQEAISDLQERAGIFNKVLANVHSHIDRVPGSSVARGTIDALRATLAKLVDAAENLPADLAPDRRRIQFEFKRLGFQDLDWEVLMKHVGQRQPQVKLLRDYRATTKKRREARVSQLKQRLERAEKLVGNELYPQDQVKKDVADLTKQVSALKKQEEKAKVENVDRAGEAGGASAEIGSEVLEISAGLAENEVAEMVGTVGAGIHGLAALSVLVRVKPLREEYKKLSAKIEKLEAAPSSDQQRKQLQALKNQRRDLVRQASMEASERAISAGSRITEKVPELTHGLSKGTIASLGSASASLMAATYILAGAVAIKELVDAGKMKKQLAEELTQIIEARQSAPNNTQLNAVLTWKMAALLEKQGAQTVRIVNNSVRGTGAALGVAKGVMVLLVGAKVAAVTLTGAASATGIGAIVIGSLALAAGVGYAAYKKRATIKGRSLTATSSLKSWRLRKEAEKLQELVGRRRELMRDIAIEERYLDQLDRDPTREDYAILRSLQEDLAPLDRAIVDLDQLNRRLAAEAGRRQQLGNEEEIANYAEAMKGMSEEDVIEMQRQLKNWFGAQELSPQAKEAMEILVGIGLNEKDSDRVASVMDWIVKPSK